MASTTAAFPHCAEESAEEAEEGWGRKRGHYYDADNADFEIEFDADAAKEEEEEGRRIQQQRRTALAAADFGDDGPADVAALTAQMLRKRSQRRRREGNLLKLPPCRRRARWGGLIFSTGRHRGGAG
jgi:hypothetical protein